MDIWLWLVDGQQQMDGRRRPHLSGGWERCPQTCLGQIVCSIIIKKFYPKKQ